MVGQMVKLDDAENIRRFVSQMRTSSSSSNGLNASSASTPSGSPPKQRNETRTSNSPETNCFGNHRTQPIDIPSKMSSNDSTPTRNSLASLGVSPISSPHTSGVRPPANTPKTQPASPHVGPTLTHNEEVGDALTDWVKNMDGKPLSDSMWAPKPGSHRHSLLCGARVPSRDLTPVKIVDVKPEVNDSFARMSFKAADSDIKAVKDLPHTGNTSPPSSKHGDKPSPTTASGTTQKLEADLVPVPGCGSIKAPHSAAKYYTFADDEAGFKAPTASSGGFKSNSRETVLPKSIEKKNVASPTAASGVPPHSRGGGTSQSSTGTAKDLASQMLTAVPNLSHADALKAQFPQQLASPFETPSSKSPGAKAANTTSPSEPQQAPVEDGLISTLKALELDGSLGPDEKVLLKNLTNRVVIQSSSQDTVTAKLADKAAEPSLPHGFINKWASKPKDPLHTRPDASPKAAEPASAADSKDSLKSTAAPLGTSKADPQMNSFDSKTTVTAKSCEDLEDLEHKTHFNEWPQLQQRDRPAAQIRKVIIKSLPANATPSFVASLIYGGPIEEIHMRETSATVRFLDPVDCRKYYDDASNGIVYGKDIQNREQVVFVELAKDVDVVGGLLRDWIDTGVTRCVRAVGVEEDWGIDALRKMGERKGKKLEGIEDGKTAGGTRSVIWRFCKIEETVQFKSALHRDEEWEHCNIHYAADPCATATSVHFDK